MIYQEIDDHTIMIWQANGSGSIAVVTERTMSILTLLKKLGIKSTPLEGSVITFTTPNSGNYQVSYSAQTVYVSTTSGFSSSIDLKHKIPQEPKPPKKYGRPDKDMRREWRNSAKTHSRNTGRKIGRR